MVLPGRGIAVSVVWLGVLSLGLASCGKEEAQSNILGCGPADQQASYQPPIPTDRSAMIFIDPQFKESPELLKATENAIATWNEFAMGHMSRLFFRSGVSNQIGVGPSHQSECSAIEGNAGSFAILFDRSNANEASSRWRGLGLSSANLAVTLRCSENGILTKQVIIVNRNYVENRGERVVLHELGHALGLEHSCAEEGRERQDYISCNNVKGGNHPYVRAIMYPELLPGMTGATLQENDRERAACRYGKG